MPDTVSPTDPAGLIDTQAIAAADAALAAAQAADSEAQAALKTAQQQLAQANRDADTAAEGAASTAAERHVLDAELGVRAAERRACRTGAAAAEAPRLHREAVGRAYRGKAFAAIERRISACAAAEAAQASIRAAQADFAKATADLRALVNIGVPIGGAVNNMPHDIVSEAHERGIWRGNQIDLEAKTFYPGERLGETA